MFRNGDNFRHRSFERRDPCPPKRSIASFKLHHYIKNLNAFLSFLIKNVFVRFMTV